MVQRFSNNRGVIENDRITDGAKRTSLLNTRRCLDEILASDAFAQAIKDEEVFLVLRRIGNRTIETDIDTLIETLRTFGTAPSYDKLAELCFRSYRGTTLTQSGTNQIGIEVALGGVQRAMITQADEILTTEPVETLAATKAIAAVSRSGEQPRNDYEYLVNYLAPNPRQITITYTES